MSALARHAASRLLCLFGRHNASFQPSVRTILSDSYKCADAWKQRLHTPILQKIDPEDFALRLQDKFDREGSVAPVDLDIFANKLQLLPIIQMDFAQSLIYRFRHTKAAIQTTDSMHYAVIRSLLEIEEYDRLREILKDKIDYGIFLDYYSANLLMDHFIKKDKFLQAAEVAFDLMMQEDFGNPITRALAWYSCHLLWKNPVDDPYEVTEAATETVEDDEDEEQFIRVDFIENPWYDDHFDIPKIKPRLGKTLTMITANGDGVLDQSYQLIGLGLYEKFDKGVELLQKWVDSDVGNVVCQEALDDFINNLESVVTKEIPETPKEPGVIALEDVMPYLTSADKESLIGQCKELVEKIVAAGKVAKDVNLEVELKNIVKSTVNQFETEDIEKQTVMFYKWNTEREELVEQQIQYYKEEALKAELEKKLDEMRETEEKLTFFDNENEIRLKARLGKKRQEIDDMFASEKLQNWTIRAFK